MKSWRFLEKESSSFFYNRQWLTFYMEKGKVAEFLIWKKENDRTYLGKQKKVTDFLYEKQKSFFTELRSWNSFFTEEKVGRIFFEEEMEPAGTIKRIFHWKPQLAGILDMLHGDWGADSGARRKEKRNQMAYFLR